MEELRDAVVEFRSNQKSKYCRWPAEIKEKCLRLYQAGHRIREIEEGSGICGNSIRSWVLKQKPASSFRAVRVHSEAFSRICLKTPQGFEVSGIDFSDFEKLLAKGLL